MGLPDLQNGVVRPSDLKGNQTYEPKRPDGGADGQDIGSGSAPARTLLPTCSSRVRMGHRCRSGRCCVPSSGDDTGAFNGLNTGREARRTVTVRASTFPRPAASRRRRSQRGV